jgi:UDP-glucose 4-epimerase
MPAALVTGGAGFIGSHLVRALLERGWQVRVLDDLSSGSEANLAGSEAELLRADVCDRTAVAQAVAGVRRVFHQAAFVSVPQSLEKPRRCFEVNLLGTLNLLDESRRAGVERVILASSCAVYGPHPAPVREADELLAGNPYAESKVAMERIGGLYAQEMGLPVISLRYFNVYGPRQSPGSSYAAVIPGFISHLLRGEPPAIHGDGLQTRDFVFVEDVVRANLLAGDSGRAEGQALNIGSGKSTSVLELAQILQRWFPQAPDPVHGAARPGDIRSSGAVIDRARDELGFRPQVDLPDGLARTVEWFRQAGRPSPIRQA